VAFAVAAHPGSVEHAVRTSAAELLPSQMIPASFVWLEALPRTTAGKVDRAALLSRLATGAGAGESRAGADGTAPHDGLEAAIAGVFADVLGAGSVGRDDDFFADLGGHSLLAVRLCSRLERTLGVKIPLREVFDYPTAARLAARLRPATERLAHDTTSLVQQLGDLGTEEVERLLAGLDEVVEVGRD